MMYNVIVLCVHPLLLVEELYGTLVAILFGHLDVHIIVIVDLFLFCEHDYICIYIYCVYRYI